MLKTIKDDFYERTAQFGGNIMLLTKFTVTVLWPKFIIRKDKQVRKLRWRVAFVILENCDLISY